LRIFPRIVNGVLQASDSTAAVDRCRLAAVARHRACGMSRHASTGLRRQRKMVLIL
jgi:hypothetical protein